jgi:hypothetical protein
MSPSQKETSEVQAAVWNTAFIDSLPDASFAWIADGGKKDSENKTTPRSLRHLPYKDANGKVDLPHVRNALARLNQVQGLSDEERAKVKTKLQNALKNAKAADDIVLRTTSSIQAAKRQDADNDTDEYNDLDEDNMLDMAKMKRDMGMTQTTADIDTNGLPTRVHLLRAGNFNTAKYGEVPIKSGDLYEMKFNFERGVGMADEGQTGLPIDFAHQSHLNAAGWIRNLDVVQADDGGTELWGTNVEWSDSGKAALQGKEYKCLSSDFYPAAFGEWVDPESGVTAKNVIVGAALTNRPLMTGNKPVIASETEVEAEAKREAEATGVKTVIYVNASETIKEKRMNLDQLRIKAAEDLTGAEALELARHANELSEDERKKFGLEAASQPAAPAQPAEKEEPKVVKAAEVNGNEGVVSVQASDLKAIQDSIAQFAEERKTDKETISNLQASITTLQADKQSSEEQKIKEEVTAHAARGAIKPEAIDSWTKMILAAEGDNRETLITSLKSLADNPLLGKQFGSKQTEGSAAMDTEAEISKKTKELIASNKNYDVYTARQQVLAADPDLAERAAQAARAAFGVFDPFKADWTGPDHLTGINADVKAKSFSA